MHSLFDLITDDQTETTTATNSPTGEVATQLVETTGRDTIAEVVEAWNPSNDERDDKQGQDDDDTPSTGFSVGQRFAFQVNDKVICNGYPGTVTEVHNGQLIGMVSVRLARGSVCVSASYPDVYPDTPSTGFSGDVKATRKASRKRDDDERETVWTKFECDGGARWTSTREDYTGETCTFSGCNCGSAVRNSGKTSDRDEAGEWFRRPPVTTPDPTPSTGFSDELVEAVKRASIRRDKLPQDRLYAISQRSTAQWAKAKVGGDDEKAAYFATKAVRIRQRIEGMNTINFNFRVHQMKQAESRANQSYLKPGESVGESYYG